MYSKEWVIAGGLTDMIKKHRLCITKNDYELRQVGCSLANTFGKRGYGFFETIYHQAKGDAQNEAKLFYAGCLLAGNKISFATLVYYAHQAGIIRNYYTLTYQNDFMFLNY